MGKSLTNIDITKAKRVVLSTVPLEAKTPEPVVEKQPLPAEVNENAILSNYEQLVKEYPLVAELKNRLNLVCEDVKKGVIDPNKTPIDRQLDQLTAIALNQFAGERIYTKNEAAEILQTHLNVTKERALNGLKMMINKGLLEPIGEGEILYLAGSTPF